LFCDEKGNRHNNSTVHSKTTHDLATQLTVAILELPYWRRFGGDSPSCENESTTLAPTVGLVLITDSVCIEFRASTQSKNILVSQ
jgi:hypothetical protein